MDLLFAEWPLLPSVLLLLAGAAVVIVAGPPLAHIAEVLAARTGMGQAVTGAILLGGSTSLSGITASIVAAAEGHASLALSNALGGIAAQTAFLAVADIFYKKANLEHTAASSANVLQAALLIALLAILLLAMLGPEITLAGIHPATPLLLAGYLFGMRLAYRTHEEPMWTARRTAVTQVEPGRDSSERGRPMSRLWLRFALVAAVLAVAGWVVARAGISIAQSTGVSQTIVGGLFTALATSTPELVTAIAAVRRGAVALAIGDIIGGNAFDTLFAAAADIVFRQGSIYHAVSRGEAFLVSLAILLTGILLMRLVRRERSGIANIGFESFLVLVLYSAGFLVLIM